MLKQSKHTKRWLLVVLLAGLSLRGLAGGIDYHYVDSVTYHYYLNQSWDSLIAVGKTALKNNIDYYYLRMRMGVAYYEKEKYIQGGQHFKKALVFNNGDKDAEAYLYDTYLLTGKDDRAYRLGMSFNESVKQTLGICPKPVEMVDVFGGYMFSNNTEKNSQIDLISPDYDFGRQTIIGDQAYAHAGLKFHITPSFSFYGSVSYLNIAKTTRFEYRLPQWVRDTTVYTSDGWAVNKFKEKEVTAENSFDGRIRQYEFYANGKIQMASGWTLQFFGNLLSIQSPIFRSYADTIVRTDTLAWNPTSGDVQSTSWEEDSVVFVKKDTSMINWVAGFSVQKDFGTANVQADMSYSELSGKQQVQFGLSFLYYPLGSTRLYGQTGFTGFFQSGENTPFGDEKRFLFRQLVGVRILKNTWLEAEYLSGNLNNVNIRQAMVVYNLHEKINFMAGLNLHIMATKHLEINLIYNYSDKDGAYRSDNIEEATYVINTFNYQTQTFIGGIKWTF